MEYNNLKKSVINQLGINDEEDLKQTLSDISNNGADGGFNGFIYYSDTCKFAKENIKEIFDYAQEQAEQLGEGVYKMISSFNCLNDVKETEVASTIHLTLKGVEDDQGNETQILNALSWYALEEVAREEVDHYGI
tara:strand:+ start:174 stop:578 length:405 start_codon:yes stop_codon:yes gene_type:complete